MTQIVPFKTSEPRLVNTIFGIAEISGPFADDYTRLNWQYTDHWSGETARFRVAGLEVFVQDRDGDDSWWMLKDLRTRKVLAEGGDCGFRPPHFFACLALAERALRDEVGRRKRALSVTRHDRGGRDMNAQPGGGEFGRGARRDVRNPVLRLAAAQGIVDLPIEQRRPLGVLLRQLADQANEQAQISWRQNKGIMAAYWKAVSVYAKHLARVIDPITARRAPSLPPQNRQDGTP